MGLLDFLLVGALLNSGRNNRQSNNNSSFSNGYNRGYDDDPGTSDISLAYGTWVCTSSTDTNGSDSYKDLFVGETLTINADKTYTSSSSSLGRTGTWSVSGNTFV